MFTRRGRSHIGFDRVSTYTGARLNRTRAMYLHHLKLLPLLLCLTACGQTGSLYLPEKTAPPVEKSTPPPQDEQASEPRE